MGDATRRCFTSHCVLHDGHDGAHQLVNSRDDPMSSCRTKARYASEGFANAVAAECYAKRGHWLRVYACMQCGGYHLTKTRAEPKPGWRPPRRSQRDMTHESRETARARKRRR